MATGPKVRVLRRLASAGILALVLSAAVFLFVNDPQTSGLYPPCVIHASTGLHCPGCGMARAVYHMLHGDVPAALGFNLLIILAMPLFCWFVISESCILLRGRPVPTLVPPSYWGWLVLALVLAFGLVRNVPTLPFTLLAP